MNLDLKDNSLIAELINNCRQTNIQLGKKIKLSREGVANRIEKLEKLNLIESYGIELNFSKLGFIPYEISIKLQGLDNIDEGKITDYFKQNKKIIFVEKALGKYDYILMFMPKNIYEMNEEIEKLKDLLKNNINEIDISIWIANFDTMSSYFTENPYQEISFHSKEKNIYRLDNIEIQLLKELTYNSKQSVVELSKKTGISVITIAKKIKNLQKEKVITNFRAFINFEEIGVSRYSMYINLVDLEVETKFQNFCKYHKSIADLTKFVGKYNYSIEIFSKNNKEFKKIVEEILKNFSKSIINYDTLILLDEIKHTPFYL